MSKVMGVAAMRYALRMRDFFLRRPWGSSGSFEVTVEEARSVARPTELSSVFFEHDGRMIHKWTHYLEIYDREFSVLRDRAQRAGQRVRFLEIGVSNGGSLEMWRKFFGPDAIIFGIDVNPACAALDGSAGAVRVGSQADTQFLRSVVDEMGGVDIVLDDGSHQQDHQRKSLEILYPLLSEDGLYVVEDLHCSYWGNFGGGYRRPSSFLEFAKSVIDQIHQPYHARRGLESSIKSDVWRISTYDSVVVLEKRKHSKPSNTRIGSPTLAP